MRTADEIAGQYLGGDAARSDLKNAILEYGEAMALAAVAAEREACARIVESYADAAPTLVDGNDDVVAEIEALNDILSEIADAIRARSNTSN